MEETSSNRERLKAVVLLLIGFIIGFATHAFTTADPVPSDVIHTSTSTPTSEVSTSTQATSSEDVSDKESQDKEVNASANNVEIDGYSLSVKDQSAGNVVHVSQVTLKENSWIAIREDSNGGMGNILGAAWYPEGRHTASVSLLRATEPDKIYYAVIYTDDGDKKFDFNKDKLVVKEDGKVLVTKFRTY